MGRGRAGLWTVVQEPGTLRLSVTSLVTPGTRKMPKIAIQRYAFNVTNIETKTNFGSVKYAYDCKFNEIISSDYNTFEITFFS